MGMKSRIWELLPFAAMVVVEILDVGLTTLSKAAMSGGMSHFVFVVYSNALATLILLPSSFIIHRNNRPPLTFTVLCKFFLLSLAGITVMQNCIFTGVSYSSPTLASALSNLIPAFTFLLAVVFRMEKLYLRSLRSQIKILGTLVSISGALIVTFVKGPPIVLFPIKPVDSSQLNPSVSDVFPLSNWVTGALFITTACLSLSIWNTAQAAVLKGYPSEMTIVSFYCFFGTIQCAILSFFVERKASAWALKLDLELAAITYSAVFGSVVTFSTQTWCIRKKGPVFVAMFKPLGIAIAALMGAIFLGDTLYTGSVIGAVVIVVGFYGVVWAQSKEQNGPDQKKEEKFEDSHEADDRQQTTPLLKTHTHV